jgi:hypothetical protein
VEERPADPALTLPAEPGAAPPATPGAAEPEAAEGTGAGAAAEGGPAAAIVGLWARGLEVCNSGESVRFEPGRFYDEMNDGTWQLEGDRLTLRSADPETGETVESVVTLAGVSGSQMQWRDQSGAIDTFYRCP